MSEDTNPVAAPVAAPKMHPDHAAGILAILEKYGHAMSEKVHFVYDEIKAFIEAHA